MEDLVRIGLGLISVVAISKLVNLIEQGTLQSLLLALLEPDPDKELTH